MQAHVCDDDQRPQRRETTEVSHSQKIVFFWNEIKPTEPILIHRNFTDMSKFKQMIETLRKWLKQPYTTGTLLMRRE